MKLASEIRLLEFTCSETSTNLRCSVVRKADVINDNERGDRNSITPESFIAWLSNHIRAKDSKRWESADSIKLKKNKFYDFSRVLAKSQARQSHEISRFFSGPLFPPRTLCVQMLRGVLAQVKRQAPSPFSLTISSRPTIFGSQNTWWTQACGQVAPCTPLCLQSLHQKDSKWQALLFFPLQPI